MSEELQDAALQKWQRLMIESAEFAENVHFNIAQVGTRVKSISQENTKIFEGLYLLLKDMTERVINSDAKFIKN